MLILLFVLRTACMVICPTLVCGRSERKWTGICVDLLLQLYRSTALQLYSSTTLQLLLYFDILFR